jgi:hypothetical protein
MIVMENINKIKSFVSDNLYKEGNIFDNFINEFEFLSVKPTNLQELKKKYNKKYIGDLFEAFCFLYIKNILKHDEIWFYKDFPVELKNKLNLTKNDFGIDIISKKDDEYYAIQCKYRKKKDQVQLVSWKALSTFYAMTSKSGPWKKHIVMTNLNGCRHVGKKDEKDLSICIKTFQNMTLFDWLHLIEKDDHSKISDKSSKPTDIEDIRKLRLKYFSEL